MPFSGARFVILLLIAAGAGGSALAATPDWSLRDYVHTVWTHRDGISLSRPSKIRQTTDGYLWFLSARTLVRFDGMRFVPMPTPCGPYALEPGADGSLWMLCQQAPGIRLFRRDAAGRFTEISLAALSLRSGPGILHDSRGRLWIFGHPVIARLEPDGRFREFRLGLDPAPSRGVEDSSGTLWFTTQRQIIRIRDDQVEFLSIPQVAGFVPAPGGGVFGVTGDRIRHLTGISETVIAHAPPDVEFVEGTDVMAVDASGRLWTATRQHGISLIQTTRVETALARNEPGGAVNTVFIDREDTVWVGSTSGLHRYRKPHARLLTSTVADIPPDLKAVFVDSRDDIWISNFNREFVRTNLRSQATQAFHIAGEVVLAFGEDETGRIWLSKEREIGFLDGGTFRPVRDATGAPVTDVWAFAQDTNGHLWAVATKIGIYKVTPGPPRRVFDEPDAAYDLAISSRNGVCITLESGGFKQYIGGREHVFRPPEPDPEAKFLRTIVDDDDTIWMGDDRGLVRWRGGRWTRWTRTHGLPGRGAVTEMTRDRTGRLWLMSEGGILVLSREDLAATPDGAPRSLRFVQIGTMDRVVPHAAGPMMSPRVGVDRAGRLYFATIDSVAIVDPRDVNPSSVRPSIVIESLAADHDPVDVRATQRLTAPSTLQFRYTSLSLRSPETIRFRYRLEGFEDDWREAGNTREVTYGTLQPGRYRFHVVGSGSEGVWNEEGAAFAFEIVPLFYNTWWFRVLVVTVMGAAIAAVHQLRVRRLARQMQIAFDARLAERTRIAGDLHDTLLQTIHGSKMVSDRALTRPDDHTGMRSAMEQLSAWLGRATTEGRQALRTLREASMDSGDLAGALRVAIDECCRQSSIDGSVSVSGEPRALDPSIRDEVQRITYEAIRNACTHSGGSQVRVALTYDRDVCVRVADNGAGIDRQTMESGKDGHFGLRGMRERAERIGAALSIASTTGTGTEVTLSVPGRVIDSVR